MKRESYPMRTVAFVPLAMVAMVLFARSPMGQAWFNPLCGLSAAAVLIVLTIRAAVKGTKEFATNVGRSLRDGADPRTLRAYGLVIVRLTATMFAALALLTRRFPLWGWGAVWVFVWLVVTAIVLLIDGPRTVRLRTDFVLLIVMLLGGAGMSLGLAVTGPDGPLSALLWSMVLIIGYATYRLSLSSRLPIDQLA